MQILFANTKFTQIMKKEVSAQCTVSYFFLYSGIGVCNACRHIIGRSILIRRSILGRSLSVRRDCNDRSSSRDGYSSVVVGRAVGNKGKASTSKGTKSCSNCSVQRNENGRYKSNTRYEAKECTCKSSQASANNSTNDTVDKSVGNSTGETAKDGTRDSVSDFAKDSTVYKTEKCYQRKLYSIFNENG